MAQADPYEVMQLSRGCTDAEIRRQYLTLVRQHPPDRDPERFAEIHQAYDLLRDPVMRLEAALFETKSNEQLFEIVAEVRQRVRRTRIPTKTLLSLAEIQ